MHRPLLRLAFVTAAARIAAIAVTAVRVVVATARGAVVPAVITALFTAAASAQTPSQSDDDVPVSPRMQAAQDRVDAFRATLARSADLRLRILQSWTTELTALQVAGPDGAQEPPPTNSTNRRAARRIRWRCIC